MAILDRYFVTIDSKPLPSAAIEFSLLGYFDNQKELASILTLFGKRMASIKEIMLTIYNTDSSSISQQMHIYIYGKGKGEYEGEKFDFSNELENQSFIGKYFDIAEKGHLAVPHHYLAEFTLGVQKKFVVFTYFNSVKEFLSILLEIGKKLKEDGQLLISLHNLQNNHKAPIRLSYKYFKDGKVLVPEVSTHFVNWNIKKEAEDFALFLWENEIYSS